MEHIQEHVEHRGGWTPEAVIARLEDAGRTLLSLPPAGINARLHAFWPPVVNDPAEAYGYTPAEFRPPRPLAREITAMDEALAWLGLIPADRIVLRRIVGARALVHPMSGRHIYSWRRLARVMHANDKSVRLWHGQGIKIIAGALNFSCANSAF